jgi:signal transduction histidine kinase
MNVFFFPKNIDGYYFGSMVFSSISAALLAIFFRVKDNPRLTLAWRLSMASTSVWSLGRALMSIAATSGAAMGWMRFSYMGSIWLAPLWLWVSYELTGRQAKRGWFWAICGVTVIFSIANFTPWFIGEVSPKLDFQFYDDTPGFLFEIWSNLFTVFLIWAHAIVFRDMRKASGHHKNRLMAFFVSGVVGFGGSATTFPLVKDVGLYPFGVLGVSLSTVLMSYAVVKHHVMDVNLAFRYGTMWVAYVFMGLVLSVGPFILLGTKPTPGWIISSFLAVGGGPFLFYFTMPTITRLVDRLPWFRGRYLSRHAVREVLASLHAVEDLDRLPWAIVERVKALVPARSCNVLLKDAGKPRFLVKAHYGLDSGQAIFLSTAADSPLACQLRKESTACVADFLGNGKGGSVTDDAVRGEMGFLRSAVALPIFFRGELTAIVNIAERIDGRPYNDVDIGHLNELAQRSEHRMETLIAGLTHQQMTSMWAHDLAKPFGPKGSMHIIDLAMEGAFGPVSPELKQALAAVSGDVGFVKANLHQVLKPNEMSMFRISSWGMAVSYDSIRRKYLGAAAEQRLAWVVDDPPESVKVLCDGPIIEHRVLANLVENAFRHTPEGGTVKMGYSLNKKEFIGFVQDTGMGIRKEDLSKLFNPGVQLNEDNRGLAGLGLASVRNVIETHKGRVWVESEWGKGSTFYFTLPLEVKLA